MIYYLVTKNHAYTMAKFLESWGRDLAGRITVVTYDSLFTGASIPKRGASFIFSDLDRLSPAAREVFGDFHDQVVPASGRGKVLNDPRRSLMRYDLLKALRERGVNRFDAWRVDPSKVPPRFPVFLRDERGFLEDAPRLLDDEAAYRAAVDELQASGEPIEHQIAVEFCDTVDDQRIYHKYGAFAVGDTIVPRHLFFSRNWLVKDAEIGDPAMLESELAFLDTNPHARALREIFRTAGIGYGRVDYSVVDGRIQVWEINTNPVLTTRFDRIPERRKVHERFVRMISAALVAFDQRAS